MRFALAQKVADAVLYEGYVLYPYRASSSKNQVRFQFGVVAPEDYCLGEGRGSEHSSMQTECLVEPGPAPRVDLKVRCLQLQARTLEEALEVEEASGVAGAGEPRFRPVELMNYGGDTTNGGAGELLVAWDEGVEKELEVRDVDLLELVRGGERRIELNLAAGREVEELRTPDGNAGAGGAGGDGGALQGRLIRQRWPIKAAVVLSAEALEADGLLRLRIRIDNQTPWPASLPSDRNEALRRSLLSAHTMLALSDGRFVSLLDPPAAMAAAAAACVNLRTWPVLIGDEAKRELVLSSPIILYDFPAIAPESPGDLCDATEIDEILTLRIMTLTDEEKREARGTDPRARRIIERADGIPEEIFERLHGAVRSLRAAVPEPPSASADGLRPVVVWPTEQEPPAAAPELSSWEAFLNPPGETPPEEATLRVGDVCIGKGSRVRLRPSRRADSMDFFLAGREARVEGVYSDVENESYIAVTLWDDLNADLSAGTGRFFYFYPDEIEPL